MRGQLTGTIVILAGFCSASCNPQPNDLTIVPKQETQPSTRQTALSVSHVRLRAAVEAGDRDEIERALDLDGDVNQDGGSALLLACATGRNDIVALLLERGANPNVRDKEGYTPLFYASGRCGDAGLVMVRALIGHGAEVNARCASGMTPLQSACETGSPNVAGLLLASGADVNASESSHGDTALHIAADRVEAEQTRANVQIIDLLLGYGANATARDAEGKTPIDLLKAGTKTRFIVDPIISAEIRDVLLAHAAGQQDAPIFP